MKKAIIYISLVALAFSSCDPMADIYDELDASNTGYKNSVEYTLVSDDYETIGDLAESVNADDAAFIAGKMYFNDTIQAAEYIPPFLAEKFPALSQGSVALVTYDYNVEMPEDLTMYTGADEYTVSDDEYESLDDVLQATHYYSPAYAPEVYIPMVLADGVADPDEGDIMLVNYEYSDVDPQVDFDNVADEVVWQENFNGSLGTFTAFDLLGDQEWTSASYGDDEYAKMSGFSGSAQDNEDWLVSGAIDLTGESEIYLNFRNAANYVGGQWDQLTVLISTDFDGSDVAGATWDQLSGYTQPAGNNWVFVESGKIDISSYAGQTIYVAFRYLSTTSNAATWEVDHVEILKPGTTPPVIGKDPWPCSAYYEYGSGEWSLMEDVYHLNAADYNAMGSPGNYDNFSSSDLPQDYLPNLLDAKYPLAGQDFEVVVVYKYYTGTIGTVTLADRYVYNNGAWESTYNYVSPKTSQFLFSDGKWVFDPTVMFTMTADDYQLIVDWVADNKGAEYIDSYGTQEFYHAAGSYYANFDLRPGKWDETVFSTWQDAVTSAIGDVLLPVKFPEAVAQVSGIDVNYIVEFETYGGPTGRFSITFQCTKSFPNPEFTLVEGPDAL